MARPAAGFGDDGASLWGHWAPQVLVVAVVATIGLTVAPLPPGSSVAALTPVLMVATVLATWVQMRRHDRALCEFCVAAMPLNPSEAARRYDRRLALAHLGGNRRALLGYLAVLVGADLAVAVAPTTAMHAVVLVWACVQSTLIYLILSHVTHRRLQPWCRRCRSGGGGDGAESLDPSPVDSSTT